MLSCDLEGLSIILGNSDGDSGTGIALKKISEAVCLNGISGPNSGIISLIGKPQRQDTLFLRNNGVRKTSDGSDRGFLL